MPAAPHIVVSATDASRLESVLANAQDNAVARDLEEELARAEIRDPSEMPAGVVQMGSRVRCLDETTHAEHVVQLVFPQQADVAAGRVSILAPVGAALLGLSAGQSIDWPLPGGRTTRLRVEEVLAEAPSPD